MEPQRVESRAEVSTIDWGRALLAGLIATALITVTMGLGGQNIMKMLGGMIVPGASTAVQYAVGGAIHLGVGLFYGLLYAWLLGPVRRRGRGVKGLLYGAALAGIALAVMPAASAMMGGGAGNPCNPCAPPATGASPANPCQPGAAAANPCQPDSGAANPCQPKAGAANPCSGGAANPPPAERKGGDRLPPGIQQILPRGGIPAVFEPRFVGAVEASIPDDAWVLGVVVEGVAKAYSLNLLNQHEVVNDRPGETAYAAVW